MTLSISSLFADNISTATLLPAARISRQTSYPLFPGIMTSSTTRSNGSDAPFHAEIAATPSEAVSTAYPSPERRSFSVSRMSASSSATSILFIDNLRN